MYISDQQIEQWIKEDVPYLDLTTHILGIGKEKGIITFTTRHETCLTGIDEVLRIFERFQISGTAYYHSGDVVPENTVFLEGQGSAQSLHLAWKVSQNILEYACGIATRTWKLVTTMQGLNPSMQLVTTRKQFPGTKELAIKAVVDGGGLPHRLGISETVLVFENHVNFLGGYEALISDLKTLMEKAAEKRILIEVDSIETAENLVKKGAEAIQFDKLEPSVLEDGVRRLRKINPKVKIVATGGITLETVAAYARTGADEINTSWVYFGKPADIKVRLNRLS